MIYQLPRRNSDSRLPQVPRRRGYQLEAAPAPLPVTEPRPAFRVDHVTPGHAAHGIHKSAPRPPSTRHNFNVQSPTRGRYKSAAKLSLIVATDAELPGMFGSIRLRIDPNACDLGRLQSGLMNYCLDHDISKPIGRMVEASFIGGQLNAKTEIATTPDGLRFMADFDAGLRQGVSPGFLIHASEIEEATDDIRLVITAWEIFEVSSTSAPKNPLSKVIGRYTMNDVQTLETAMPELVSTSDPVTMSIHAGRVALRSGQAMAPDKRAKLETFYKEYDARIARGETRIIAATGAREAAGIAVA